MCEQSRAPESTEATPFCLAPYIIHVAFDVGRAFIMVAAFINV